MSHNAVFRWGCFVNASLVVSLLASGCTSRVDLAEERASNSSAAGAPADVNGTGGAGDFYRKCGFASRGRVVYKGTPLLYFELLLR